MEEELLRAILEELKAIRSTLEDIVSATSGLSYDIEDLQKAIKGR